MAERGKTGFSIYLLLAAALGLAVSNLYTRRNLKTGPRGLFLGATEDRIVKGSY